MRKNITFRLDPEAIQKLGELAKNQNRSRNNMIEQLIYEKIQDNERS